MRMLWYVIIVIVLLDNSVAYSVPCSSLVVKRTGKHAVNNYQSYPTETDNCDWLEFEVLIRYDVIDGEYTYIVEFLPGAVNWDGVNNSTVYWIYNESTDGTDIPLRVNNLGTKSVGVYISFVNNNTKTDFTNIDVNLGSGNLIAAYVDGDIKSISVGGQCSIQATGNLYGTITCGRTSLGSERI